MEWEDALEKLQLLLLLESKGSFLTESTETTPRLLKQLSVRLSPIGNAFHNLNPKCMVYSKKISLQQSRQSDYAFCVGGEREGK